jgi:hypothetical protein
MRNLLRGVVSLASVAAVYTASFGYGTATALADPDSLTGSQIIQRELAAENAGDLAGVMVLFTNDAVRQGVGLCAQTPCRGEAAVQRDMQRHLAEHPFTTNLELQQVGSTVTGRNAVETDSSRSIGLDRYILEVTYEVRGNQIVAQRITADTSDVQTAWYVHALQTSPALAVDPSAIHQQYVDATNSGDVARAVAQFASDAIYAGGSCQPTPCIGQTGIEREIAGNVASHVHITRLSAEPDGDTVTWRSEVSTDGIRAAGIERIVTTGTTRVRDGLIVEHEFGFDMADPQTAAYAAFLRAQHAQPADDAESPGN